MADTKLQEKAREWLTMVGWLLLVCAGCAAPSSRDAAEAHGIHLPHQEQVANESDRELKPGYCYCDNGTSRCKNEDGTMLTLVGGCSSATSQVSKSRVVEGAK